MNLSRKFYKKARPSKGYQPERRRAHRFERLEIRTLLDGAGAAPAAAYGQLPLSFEINQGQTDSQVNFLAHGSGYGLYLTPGGAVLSLQHPSAAGNPPSPLTTHDSPLTDTLQMQFVGANPAAQAVGVDKLAGVSNYLIGNDPAKWHTSVANYGQVEYQDLYSGVNLIYYGNQRQLEYDFVVAAGADPSQIAFSFAGAQSTTLDAQGNLVLHTAGGDVVEHAPVIYQQINGVRHAVEGRYVLLPSEAPGSTSPPSPLTTHQIGFAIGAYDHSQAMVIDPILSYSTYLGGSSTDQAAAIAVDTAGEAFVAGFTTSPDFPTTPGAPQTSLAKLEDAFVTRLNAAGTAVVYSTYLSGFFTGAHAIAVDAAGEAYVAGQTLDSNFPTTPGAFQPSMNGVDFSDAFVAKLNAAGTRLLYSTYLGGSGIDRANAIAVDAAGNAYVAGDTNSSDFPANGRQPRSFDAFVVKFNDTGTRELYANFIGGSGDDYATGIAVDGAGNTYVTGTTNSTDFITSSGAIQTTLRGSTNTFVTKLSADFAEVYFTYLGGSGADQAAAIAVDPAGNAYVTGSTNSTEFPTTADAVQTSSAGGNDAFVAKLNAAGTSLDYSTYLGGSADDQGSGIAVDAAGDAYVAGFSSSDDFPTTSGALQTSKSGGEDAFIAKLNPAGTALIYSTYLGGGGSDGATGIAVDAAGAAYVAGTTFSTNFPTTSGAWQSTLAGPVDAFVAKIATAALVLNAAPVATTEGAPFTGVVGFLIDEAQAFDPASNFSVLIGWGDGGTSTASVVPFQNGFNLLAAHTYAEDGQYAMTVTVVDADGDSATAFATTTVADGLLSGVSKTAAFTEGAALLRSVASFEDADPKGAVGDYTASIDWGDGQTTTGTVVADGAIFDVNGLYQYAADGSLPITVVVHDVGGANFDGPGPGITINSTAVVADSLAAKPINLNVIGGKSFNGFVASFADADNSKLGATDYVATITWDDGTTTIGTFYVQSSGPGATFFVRGSHQFASFSGFHTISVAITDLDDGGVTTVIDSVLDPPGLTPNQIYVLNAYLDAFGAAGTTTTMVAGASLADWAAKLDAGASHASFATALLHSDEHYGSIVGTVYQKYLGRKPDDGGVAYWVGQMRQGMADEQLEASFAAAAEFYQHAGGSDSGWVGAMYLDILGRAADASGVAFWTGQLAQGADRAAVAQGFAAGVEREAQRVQDDYFAELGRTADAAGQAYWVNSFEHGMHNEDVIAGFLASDEYDLAHLS